MDSRIAAAPVLLPGVGKHVATTRTQVQADDVFRWNGLRRHFSP